MATQPFQACELDLTSLFDDVVVPYKQPVQPCREASGRKKTRATPLAEGNVKVDEKDEPGHDDDDDDDDAMAKPSDCEPPCSVTWAHRLRNVV